MSAARSAAGETEPSAASPRLANEQSRMRRIRDRFQYTVQYKNDGSYSRPLESRCPFPCTVRHAVRAPVYRERDGSRRYRMPFDTHGMYRRSQPLTLTHTLCVEPTATRSHGSGGFLSRHEIEMPSTSALSSTIRAASLPSATSRQCEASTERTLSSSSL